MRRTGLRRKPGRSEPRTEAALVWARTARVGRCAVCNRQARHGHHVIYKQHLRQMNAAPALMWDLRNMLALCEQCHARHHQAFRRIPRKLLPSAALEFAAELGLDWLIERTYP